VTKYDDADWHYDGATAAGQPIEHAFAHIGLYLGWLIRRGFHRPDMFTAEDVAAVRSGEMTGSDLADEVDAKLASDMIADEGRRFTDFYYNSTFLKDFSATFPTDPDYSVADDAASYARIGPVLDHAFEGWVAAGRPGLVPQDPERRIETPAYARGPGIPNSMTSAELDAFMDDLVSRLPVHEMRVDEMEPPHEAPDLERLVRDRLGAGTSDIASATANHWGSSKLSRALKRLGVHPRDATVVSAIAGDGEHATMVAVYVLPEIDAATLEAEFATAIHRPSPRPWQPTEIAGRRVLVADGREFIAIYWAVDGMVFHLGASKGVDLTPLVERLATDRGEGLSG
jgi:hypothetical protein